MHAPERSRPPGLDRMIGYSAALHVSVAVLVGWTFIGCPRSVTWACVVCARNERSFGYPHLSLARSETDPDPEIETAVGYRDWLARAGGVAHEHQWQKTGCYDFHYSGQLGFNLFYGVLPDLPDTGLALDLVDRLARTPPEKRRELLLEFHYDPLDLGDAPSCVAVFAAYGAWLERHPAWR